MRRVLFWYVPIGAALIAAAVFADGFYSFMRGDTGTAVNVVPPRAQATAPRNTIAPLVVGDSLARGTGDESGLGIGGRLVDELKRRRIPTKNAVNLAINGARTADLLQQLDSRNVRVLIGQANVIIVSIGGNDLWGDNWRNVMPRDPEVVMDAVLDRMERVVKVVSLANPQPASSSSASTIRSSARSSERCSPRSSTAGTRSWWSDSRPIRTSSSCRRRISSPSTTACPSIASIPARRDTR
jgi:hypothetical protein